MAVTWGKWKGRAGLGKGKIPRLILDVEGKQKKKKGRTGKRKE